MKKISYQKRIEITENLAAKKLFGLMEKKKTNLTLTCDETDPARFFEIIDGVGSEIAVLKTHIDTLENFSWEIIKKIEKLSQKHNFLIFEDRKFADIGNTVKFQYSGGVYKIVEWAHLTNAHSVPGPGVVEGLWEVAKEKIENGQPRGCLLLAQMSSKDNLATGEYTQKTVELAKNFSNFVFGFIGTGSKPSELKKLVEISPSEFIIMTPGVKIGVGKDKLSQRYAEPEEAIQAGSDSIIVGRGIYQADDPQKTARQYRQIAWQAYLDRIK